MLKLQYTCNVNHVAELPRRRGARRLSAVPDDVLRLLERGDGETVNLMEWLAADMSTLARTVAKTTPSAALRGELETAAGAMAGQGVTRRLSIAGRAIARALPALDAPDFLTLARHKSDLVRQWACYAVNEPTRQLSVQERLARTKQFAADPNMSVREAAWMAFRPYLQLHLAECLQALETLVHDSDPNIRRFSVEVTRPRSVWGAHLPELKRSPSLALRLLESVKRDGSRYVQLAVGNWLNDASKSQPVWVSELCGRWGVEGDKATAAIVRRGLRTLKSGRGEDDSADLLRVETVAKRRMSC
jgi:3-methyladenine DNA glycosylase AlkC